MSKVFRPTTTKVLPALLAAISLAGLVLAHEGFAHVMGTVSKVEQDAITVTTATGDVVVKLGPKTEYTKDDKKAAVSDLAVGLRVVVDLPEKEKAPAAHSVKIGVADTPAKDDHSAHK